jgi:hypothetical protein
MSKVKNISGGPRYVPLLDREVADGEIVEVPDYQPASNPDDGSVYPIVWPDVTWEPVTAKDAKAAAKDAKADDTSGKADG